MMTRKRFLRVAGAGSVALMNAPLFDRTEGRSHPDGLEKNWVWMEAPEEETGDENWNDLFARMANVGMDAVLVQEEDPSTLREMVAVAQGHGLEVHVWTVVLRRDDYLDSHPEWYAVNRRGVSTAEDPPYVDYYHFLSPCVDAVREALVNRVDRLAGIDGVAGIHLDYLRFPDVILPSGRQSRYDLDQDREEPRFDYGYHDACRAKYEQRTGTDPINLDDPPKNEEWVQFRYDQVTQVASRLGEVVHDHDKQLSAAVFATPDIARRLVRQNWAAWPLDAVMPMIYHEFYEKRLPWIEVATKENVGAPEAGPPVYSGLFVPDLTPDELAAAARYAQVAGARGVALFRTREMTRNHWDALENVLAR